MPKITRTVKHVRGPVGKIIKWLFIGFNLLMVFWLFSYWGDIVPMMNTGSGAEQAGTVIGSTIGTGMILMIWVLGAIVLGIPVLLTKGKRVETEETPEESLPIPTSQDNVKISQEAVQKHHKTQSSGDVVWGAKFKTGLVAFARYTFFASCFLIGLALLVLPSSIFAVSGVGFIVLGLIFLPQIKRAMVAKELNKPARKILVVVGIIAFLSYIGTPDSPNLKMANKQKQAEQAKEMQANVKEETREKEKQKSQERRTTEILEELKTIPVSEYQKNYRLYRDLQKYHPEIQKYRNKVKFYRDKIAEKKRRDSAQLKLLSWGCVRERSHMKMRGEIKNQSGARLENILVVATYRTKSGEFVISDSALVEYNPLMPGQTSPFEVMTRYNPAIEKCNLGFKTIRGKSLSYYSE